jgi:hypothetical protein
MNRFMNASNFVIKAAFRRYVNRAAAPATIKRAFALSVVRRIPRWIGWVPIK